MLVLSIIATVILGFFALCGILDLFLDDRHSVKSIAIVIFGEIFPIVVIWLLYARL